MSNVYIEIPPVRLTDEPEYLQLTVSTSLSFSMDNQLTSNPIADRRNIVDHSISGNKVFTVSGVISNIKNLSLNNDVPQLSVGDNIKKFESLRDSRKPFIFHYDNDQDPKKDCIFRSVSFSKAANQGQSYSVSLVVEQANISTQVLTSNEKFVREGDIQNQFGSKDFSGNGNTEKEDLKTKTLYNQAAGFFSLLSDAVFGSDEETTGGDE